jgi:nitrate reductase NapE component
VNFEGENLLVGLVCLALVPLIAARIVGAIRNGRVPLYRSYVERRDNEAKFFSLLTLHIFSLLLIAFIAADLLLGLGFRESL